MNSCLYMADAKPGSATVTSGSCVKIRQGMKFSDGQAITADDWITTWKTSRRRKVGSNSYDAFFLNGKTITIKKLDTTPCSSISRRSCAGCLRHDVLHPGPTHVFGKAYREGQGRGSRQEASGRSVRQPSQIVSPGMWVLNSFRRRRA